MLLVLRAILFVFLLTVANGAAGVVLDKASGLVGSYWPNPSNVIVCWDTPGYSREKTWVRRAVRLSWEAHSALRFRSWADCRTEGGDIRIEIGEFGPGVEGLGTQIRNVSGGMKLNFRFQAPEFNKPNATFYKWCRQRLESCIKIIAVHEFGHAIGLAHEQNRPDAHANCKLMGLHQGSIPNHLITVYDPHSVMNYCSKRVGLSRGDIQALQILYNSKEGNCSLHQNKAFRSVIEAANTSMQGYRSDECCGLCSKDPACEGFVWHQRNGGTCYLHTVIVGLIDAPGYISGVSNQNACGSENIYTQMGKVLVNAGWKNNEQISNMDYEDRRDEMIVRLFSITNNTLGELYGMGTPKLLRIAGCAVVQLGTSTSTTTSTTTNAVVQLGTSTTTSKPTTTGAVVQLGTTTNTSTTTAADRCILLIGGELTDPILPAIEYYHPTESECDTNVTGTMSTLRINDTKYTSACYLSDTQQIVVREVFKWGQTTCTKPPMIYGLRDSSAEQLPLPYKNSSGAPAFTRWSMAAPISPSVCLFCGGRNTTYHALNQCYLFDASLATRWSEMPSIPRRLFYATSLFMSNNNSYYVTGGSYGGSYDHALTSRQLFRYSVSERRWYEETPMSQTRFAHSAAALSATEFIACGGTNAPFGENSRNDCEVYNTTAKKWRRGGNLNRRRYFFALVNFARRVYAIGGLTNEYVPLLSVEEYDGRTEKWTARKKLKHRRFAFGAVVV